MKFKMEWDGLVDCNGHKEIRTGIHIVIAKDDIDAIQRAYDFFNNGGFLNWDAILEDINQENSFVITSDK